MNLIAQNPYRILGVFANDPLKKRTANISRISAFRKVSQNCTFDSDLTDIFGPIDRSEESVNQAIVQLSNENDAEFYSFFWLHSTSVDFSTFTASADLLIANNKRATFQEVINTFVVSTFIENYQLSGDAIFQLFDCYRYISSNAKSLVFKNLISKCSSITLSSWWNIFKEKFSAEKPDNELFSFYLKEFYSLAVDSINNTMSASTLKKDYPRWKNISNLHHYAKPVIEILKETNSQYNGADAETQIILSEYANIMLSACIRYCDSTRFWEAQSVEDILIFLRELYRISYSSQVRERCTVYGKKLKEQINYLAPQSVRAQAESIHDEIDEFCHKPNKACWALELLEHCYQPLLSIRSTLGERNLYYNRISTQIADDAIFVSETDMDQANELYSNEKNRSSLNSFNSAELLYQCLQVFVNLKQLDLEQDFIESKLMMFRERIEEFAKSNRLIIGQDPKPTFSFSKDKDPFENCNDYQSLLDYLSKYPTGKHVNEARERIWSIEDDAYPQIGTSISDYRKALLEYVKQFPKTHNKQKALDQIEKMLLGPSFIGTVDEYRLMLELWPEHPKKAIILGRLELSYYKNCRSISDYKKYLNEFPNGKYKQEAQQKINQITNQLIKGELDKCTTIQDYRNFVAKYPLSIYALNAKKEIEELIYKEVLLSHKYETYYQLYPKGRFFHEIISKEDEEFYQNCLNSNDLQQYLKKFPNGIHAKDIKNRLNEKSQRKVILVVVAVIVSFIFIPYLFEDHGSEHKSTSHNSSQTKSEVAENYENNSLETGDRPYASYFGGISEGDNYIDFKTSGDHDYIAIVKRHEDDFYINHIYINGGDRARMYVPDGYFDVYFYSGKGWNPNKKVGVYHGGFDKGSNMQKDGPIELYSAYMEYTLYPVAHGNLRLKGADMDDVFK